MGDLNMHEPSEDGVLVREQLLDLWAETNSGQAGYTFDPVANSMIKRYIPGESRRMRLDRILLSAGSPWKPHRSVRMWAEHPLGEELFLSDHFGLYVDLAPSNTPARSSARVLAQFSANSRRPFVEHSVRNASFALALVRHVGWLCGRSWKTSWIPPAALLTAVAIVLRLWF
jgi:hypothetical protein